MLLGDSDYEHHFNETDELSESQKNYAQAQLEQFQRWWQDWPGPVLWPGRQSVTGQAIDLGSRRALMSVMEIVYQRSV